MRRLKTITTDFLGLCRVCGIWVALRWLMALVIRFPACYRAGHAQPADEMLGDGPINVRLGNAKAKLVCWKVLTGIRETWARDGYLDGGFLKIAPDATVVDLGSNMGGFTILALAHGPGVRVIAVEADSVECPKLQRNLELNGWTSRVTAINAFVGGLTQYQQQLRAADRCATVPVIGEDELLTRAGGRINFLKCDIEGSEFDLLYPGSRLLAATDQIAMEVHPDAGDAEALVQQLKAEGFEIRTHVEPPTITVLGRRPR